MSAQRRGLFETSSITLQPVLDIEYLFPNGHDLEANRMDEMNLSDKQRDMVLRLSEKRRKLKSLQTRAIALEEPVSPRKNDGLDLNAFEDRKRKEPAVGKEQTLKFAKQVEDLEAEVEELTSSLMISLGLDPSEEARRKREDLASRFEEYFDGWQDDFFDQTGQTDQSEYPEIPRMDKSENIESVESKLAELYRMQQKSERVLSGHESEKRLNEIANEDEEVDPLDAFMASNSVELASQQILKEKAKLEAINLSITKLEKLRSILSKNQFGDSRISAAIEQRTRVENIKRKQEALSESESAQRGTGTVWEEEFRKDETVPKRKSIEKSVAIPTNSGGINFQLGGLQLPGHHEQTPAAWKPPSEMLEKKQEELRKRLGY